MLSRVFRTPKNPLAKNIGNYKVNFISGKSQVAETNTDVNLRGIQIKGKYEDLPNLIFFPDVFDIAENWLPFFTNPHNQFLEYRNVHILYPRNFGTSDHNEDFSSKAIADDVARYMWQNEFSTATVGGHGLGASFALKAAIEHFDRTTGFFAIDYTPVNYNRYEVFQNLVEVINNISLIPLNSSKGAIFAGINLATQDEKWRRIFKQNLTKVDGQWQWTFNLAAIQENINAVGAGNLANWGPEEGIYPGRNSFIFPDESDHFFVGSNTLPIYNTLTQNRGWGTDIHSIPSPENSQSHWVYEIPSLRRGVAYKLIDFLRLYDGVHVLNSDRNHILSEFVPERNGVEDGRGHHSDGTLPHFHHNWRYNNVYGN